MKLSELKTALSYLDEVSFTLPSGKQVPSHFHITEIGKISKDFIDCGGKRRQEETISMQLWTSVDFYHRLKPEKLLTIINMAETNLFLTDSEIEVEYQDDTIGKYALSFKDGKLQLDNKNTACLASDACGIGAIKEKLSLSALKKSAAECCEPGAGCC